MNMGIYDECNTKSNAIGMRYQSLDMEVEHLERINQEHRDTIRRNENRIKQLRKVRKLVTPEMEEAVKVMRENGLL